MAGGRPTLFKSEYVSQAEKLSKLGFTDLQVADFFGVAESTLNTWKHKHPEFAESLKIGKGEADEMVEKSLYRRALGYEHMV